jgi:hypothetical protein
MKSDLAMGIITFVLWGISVAFSFYVILEFQQMVLRRVTDCCADNRFEFQVYRQWSTIFFIGIWLGYAIISLEYHNKHLRKESSKNFLKWSFLVMLVILALALIL